MPPKIKAMLVMARERRLLLLDALESCGIEVLPVCDCNEARRMFETQPPVQVVVTDTTLPDGDWRRVLEIVAQGLWVIKTRSRPRSSNLTRLRGASAGTM